MTDRLPELGKRTKDAAKTLLAVTGYFGLFLARLAQPIHHPSEFRLTAIVHHREEVGPIVAPIAFLIGVVLAFQGSTQLRQFRAEVFVVDLIAISILRELGILLTSIIVAGRSGSAFTAAIGSKKMRAEINEMRSLGLYPATILFVPHILALAIMLPILGLIANLMGLSGSDKFTLVRCFSRLHEITAGTIEVDGIDIARLSERELIELRRNKIGMVFQSFGLLPHRTMVENIAFPLEMRGQDRHTLCERALEVIKLVGLEGREDYFPREMSGGQQQRVGIARGLAIKPDIWFLDESFSALDPLILREMQDEFFRLQGLLGKTIVFINHDFDEALRLADRIAIMKDGVVEQCDAPNQIVLHSATEYVRKFTADIDKARVVHERFGRPCPASRWRAH